MLSQSYEIGSLPQSKITLEERIEKEKARKMENESKRKEKEKTKDEN